MRVPSPPSSLLSSWPRSVNAGAFGRYSRWKAAHMSAGLISVPLSSVMAWMVLENSICSRRGRSKPCSIFMMKATPPLPDWLLTRITAS